jgi:hypothetical protein
LIRLQSNWCLDLVLFRSGSLVLFDFNPINWCLDLVLFSIHLAALVLFWYGFDEICAVPDLFSTRSTQSWMDFFFVGKNFASLVSGIDTCVGTVLQSSSMYVRP